MAMTFSVFDTASSWALLTTPRVRFGLVVSGCGTGTGSGIVCPPIWLVSFAALPVPTARNADLWVFVGNFSENSVYPGSDRVYLSIFDQFPRSDMSRPPYNNVRLRWVSDSFRQVSVRPRED